MNPIQVPFHNLKTSQTKYKNDFLVAFEKFIESGNFVLGSETIEFEKEYAEYCSAGHCVGVSNGLDALHLALKSIGIQAGDEVIVPSNTYIATWLSVSHSGARVIPVEPDIHTFNINPNLVERHITTKTKAILAVNLYGQPCDYDRLGECAKSHGIKLIIDNAQAHGATYRGRRVGGIAHIECHSFYPTKNLGALGEGGAVTTNDPEIANRIRLLRNYGSRIRYENELIGFNNRIHELQAAFLRIKLRDLDNQNAQRATIANMYLSGISNPNCNLTLPKPQEWSNHVWHLFVILCERRDKLKTHLEQRGISTLIHYPTPPHKSRAYLALEDFQRHRNYPIAEKIASTALSLPIYPAMTAQQVKQVIDAMNSFEN